jgi:hypothetical protein
MAMMKAISAKWVRRSRKDPLLLEKVIIFFVIGWLIEPAAREWEPPPTKNLGRRMEMIVVTIILCPYTPQTCCQQYP